MKNDNQFTVDENKQQNTNNPPVQKKKSGFLGKFVIILLIILLICMVLIGIWRVSRGPISSNEWREILSNVTYNDYDFWDNISDENIQEWQSDIDGNNDDLLIDDDELPNVVEGVFSTEESIASLTRPANEIDNIEVSVVNSQVIFENTQEDQVSIEVFTQNGGMARIRYNLDQKGNTIRFTEKKSSGRFIIRVSIPEKVFRSIQLNDVNADIEIDQFRCEKLDINSVNGDIRVAGDCKKLTLNSVNGNMDIRANQTEEVKATTVGGNIVIDQNIINPKTDISTVSGNIELIYPKDVSVDINISTVGSVETPLGKASKSQNGSIGNGRGNDQGKLTIGSVSGHINVRLSDKEASKQTQNANSLNDTNVATASDEAIAATAS